jgi:hypothetical protein
MVPGALGPVMMLLERLPIPGQEKEEILLGWARTVGVKVNASQRDAVRHSGTDY